jgi:hypothetical protein
VARLSVIGGFLLCLLPVPAGAQDVSIHFRGYRHEAEYRRPVVIEMWLRNETSAPIADVRLSASGPRGWLARLEPDVLGSVAPGGGTEEFRLIVEARRTVFPQRGSLSVEARAPGLSRSARVEVTAMPPRFFWPSVGFALALTVGGLFVALFRRSSGRP